MTKAEAGTVRDFEREDAEAVARLFQATFRKSRKKPFSSLPAYLNQAFLDHPWAEPDIRSKVFAEADGRISGFVGIFPSRLELNGRPVRAAFASSLMVENPKENPLAGARLVRAFLTGPQDLSLTETANHTAQSLFQKAGHPLDPAYSLNWIRVFRPLSTGVRLAERGLSAARLLRPLGRIADRGIVRLAKTAPEIGEGRKLSFKDVTPDVFAEALQALKNVYPLRPRWDAESLRWFVGQAEQKRNFGYPEWRVGYGPDGRPLAAYTYFTEAGGIGWVLQAASAPARSAELVEDMFEHAYSMGCAALRGSAHPWLTPALMTRKTLFFSRTFYIAQAKDKTLLEPIKAGEALVSGLAGEGWMRLLGDRFDD